MEEEVAAEGQLSAFQLMGGLHRRSLWDRHCAVQDRAASGLTQSKWVQDRGARWACHDTRRLRDWEAQSGVI